MINIKKFTDKFPEYKGEQNFDETIQYMKNNFLELSQKREPKDIFIHETCAISTDHIQVVWGFMRESIFKVRMAHAGMNTGF